MQSAFEQSLDKAGTAIVEGPHETRRAYMALLCDLKWLRNPPYTVKPVTAPTQWPKSMAPGACVADDVYPQSHSAQPEYANADSLISIKYSVCPDRFLIFREGQLDNQSFRAFHMVTKTRAATVVISQRKNMDIHKTQVSQMCQFVSSKSQCDAKCDDASI